MVKREGRSSPATPREMLDLQKSRAHSLSFIFLIDYNLISSFLVHLTWLLLFLRALLTHYLFNSLYVKIARHRPRRYGDATKAVPSSATPAASSSSFTVAHVPSVSRQMLSRVEIESSLPTKCQRRRYAVFTNYEALRHILTPYSSRMACRRHSL